MNGRCILPASEAICCEILSQLINRIFYELDMIHFIRWRFWNEIIIDNKLTWQLIGTKGFKALSLLLKKKKIIKGWPFYCGFNVHVTVLAWKYFDFSYHCCNYFNVGALQYVFLFKYVKQKADLCKMAQENELMAISVDIQFGNFKVSDVL